MPNPTHVNFASPTNQPILAYLGITEPGTATVKTPKEVNHWSLGTHPDLVEYFWGLVRESCPDCACVIDKASTPLLAHPTSGIIFGLAGGTQTLALRLPEPERTLMLAVAGFGTQLAYPHKTILAIYLGEAW